MIMENTECFRTAGKQPGRGKKSGRLKFWLTVRTFILLSCLTILAGCGEKASTPVENKSENGYSLPEIMVIAMTEKNRYEVLCTDQIWNVSIGEGEDFESYLTGQIKGFMDELKIMNLLALDRNMALTPGERSDMEKAAKEYYGKLTKEDISYMGVTLENVRTVFEDYCMAEKLVEELTKGFNLEVSDSEAKVITIMQAETKERQAAETLYAALMQENADFLKCAEEAGLSAGTRQLGRKEEGPEFEEVAFALTTGEVGRIVEADGKFYVIKCISDYDEEATAIRKGVIFEERKRMAFREIYDSFRANINLIYPEEPWEKLDISSGRQSTKADFFEIYRKYSGQ